jgi:hypothetical protein
MKGLALFIAAVLLGAAAGELLCRWPGFRDLAGRVTGRGALIKVVNGKGMYASDLGGEEEVTAADATLAENLRRAAVSERPHEERVARELGLVKAQFGNDQAFEHALATTRLSIWSLHEAITDQLRGWQWFER